MTSHEDAELSIESIKMLATGDVPPGQKYGTKLESGSDGNRHYIEFRIWVYYDDERKVA